MPKPLPEPFKDLEFSRPDKALRYETSRYKGAVGRNWYECDPTLKFMMEMHLGKDGLEWAEPHLSRIGALMGGPIAERAELTDKNPPYLKPYDRWGHDISEVVMPSSFVESKADLMADNFTSPEFARLAEDAGVRAQPLATAWSYLLNQAEIGMTCSLGTGGEMVVRLAEEFAPDEVKERVRELFAAGDLAGEAVQMLTERAGGSDLGAIETTAARDGDAWRLSGLKWFASNANGSAFVVLAKPEGSVDATRGVAPFLVLWERRDGSRNGLRIRRLKDKLGTKAVASAEVELIGAEAYMLAPGAARTPGRQGAQERSGDAGDGKGLSRMMALTNGARLGIAMMGLGCARRSLVESICFTSTREAFGRRLIDQPLMMRKLAELIVEVEATQALVFDGYLGPRQRLGAPVIKLRAARLGITAASDAIEIHGGNGYVEDWPVARLLRDAQVNTVWEGPDNILCLDVRRGIEREEAHLGLLERIISAVSASPPETTGAKAMVEESVVRLEKAIDAWKGLDRPVAEARLFPLSVAMGDVYAGALLLEQAGRAGDDQTRRRKLLVARLFAKRHLESQGLVWGIDEPAEDLDNFTELVAGTFLS